MKSILMMKKMIKAMALAVVFQSSFLLSAKEAIVVNPIPAIQDDFIKGADVSMLPQMEQMGGKFYDNGVEKDCMEILRDHGVNWIRLRIWNHPYNEQGEPLGGGNDDEEAVLAIAERAKKLGLKLLIDFHYSDFWADPSKQFKPAVWEGHNSEQLAQDVYDYTAKVIRDCKARGFTPDMVQIGNEIQNGMLWPEGRIKNGACTPELAAMLSKGMQAAHDTDRSIKVMLHLPEGGNKTLYRTFFDALIFDYKVNDFDVIGVSFYPFWNGTMEALESNLNEVSARYGKDVVVAETAFAYTDKDSDNLKCNYFNEIGGYKSTVQGQASGLRDLMAHVVAVQGGHGKGIFYWEPDWFPMEDVGWQVGEDSVWDSLAMFDEQGNALASLDVFSLVSDKRRKTVKNKIVGFEPVLLEGGLDVPVELPATVTAVYRDDSIAELPVIWKKTEPIYGKLGTYKLKGSVAGTRKKAAATITIGKKANLVKNSGFESSDLSDWKLTGDLDAVAISAYNDSKGKVSVHYWAAEEFRFRLSQSFDRLPDGLYTLTCLTQGGGGEKRFQLFVEDSDGRRSTADISDTGWNEWQQCVLQDVEIRNGGATIGVEMDANPGNWGSIDNFEFYLQVE